MNDDVTFPLEEASSFYFEVDELGSSSIEIITRNGDTFGYDRIDLVMIDHVPFFLGSVAVSKEEEMFYFPLDMMPTDSVTRIRNNLKEGENESLSFPGVW